MKLSKYLKDKLYAILIFLLTFIIIMMLFYAFKLEKTLTIVVGCLLLTSFITCLLIDYFRKKNFYSSLINTITKLDKAYLVTSTLEYPNFYEGKILFEALYDTGKSMSENVNALKSSLTDFKEYLEMWIHEVKVPLSSLILMAHNHPNLFDKSSLEQIRRIESHVDQVLYYIRQEASEKDYLIKEIHLDKLINQVAQKNREDLLANDISLLASNITGTIHSDSKWLEFILNQILNNSIKYKRNDVESYIKIWSEEDEHVLKLLIEDNGVGIPSQDLPRIFDKSFTGQNGRTKAKSTGMGLYIAKNLLKKLGHDIEVASKEGKYTRITITFFKNEFYAVAK